jgi:hypothetical protein
MKAAVTLLSLLLAGPTFAADQKDELIAVSIAIPVHHQHRSLNESDHFHVLTKNVSDKPVRLWTDRFSWGYDSLSFELIGDDGSVTRIAKKPRGWGKNYPDWLELAPGESWVINVNWFSPQGREIWENVPVAPEGSQKPKLVKSRHVYGVRPDGESEKLRVCTGKVLSPVGTYAIW